MRIRTTDTPFASATPTVALAAALVATLVAAAAFALAGCAEPEPPTVVDPRPPVSTEPTMPGEPPEPDLDALEISFTPVADGFEQPLYVTGANDRSGRLFVAEKTGRLQVVGADGDVRTDPFLDLSGQVSTESERGLLGVAFTPDFAQSRVLYVSYTDTGGTSVLARFDSDGERADRASEQVVLRVEQPFANHNGGGIEFGPDGYLYFGLGDGGSGGDPLEHGQNPGTLLGAMLRIDVGGPGEWHAEAGVPPDNPFVGVDGAEPLIWSYGLRNPWRFSFDRATDDLWIADVGQNAVEEINFQPADSPGGENWGWNLFEGTAPYPPDREVTEDRDEFAWPIVEYRHPIGRSVTGGYVYRGEAYPAMRGVYLYGDYVTGRIWGLARTDAGVENRELAETDMQIASFGEDDDGEVYAVDFRGGGVYRIEGR